MIEKIICMNEFTFYVFYFSPVWIPVLILIGFTIKDFIDDNFKK